MMTKPNGFLDLSKWQTPLCFRVSRSYYPPRRLDVPTFQRTSTPSTNSPEHIAFLSSLGLPWPITAKG